MVTPIDFQPYARPPRIDALGGVALVHRMLRAGYAGKNPATISAFANMRARAVTVQDELKKRGRTASAPLRPFDIAFDNGWSGLRNQLQGWSLVHDPKHANKRARAEALLASYFPTGVDFVQLAYEEEWVYSAQLLERFVDEGATSDLESLTDPAFLDNVRVQHARLGEALNLTGRARGEDPASPTGLAEKVIALAAAIGEYTRRHSGEVDTDKEASVEAFRKSMEPLDRYRARNAPGAKDGTKPPDVDAEDPIDPAAPLPNLPPPFTEGT